MKTTFLILIAISILCIGAQAAEGTSTIYVVEYEGYSWDPCSYEANGMSRCFAVLCPTSGCRVSAETHFVNSLKAVEELIEKRGVEHLVIMYRVEWDGERSKITPLELKPTVRIVEKKEKAP